MIPVMNVARPAAAAPALGRVWPCGHRHPDLDGLSEPVLGFGPPPPGVCCQATPDGGTVCSNGFVGPAG